MNALATVMIVAVAAFAGCAGRDIIVVERTIYCAVPLEPPPAEPDTSGVLGRGQGLPPCFWHACVGDETYASLVAYLYRIRDWSAEAWRLCRPRADGGPT